MAPKGDESKRNPVRIFSFDSFKSTSSLDKLEHVPGGRGSPKPSIDSGWQAPDKQDWENRDAADQNWTDKERIESPKLVETPLSSQTSSVGPEQGVSLRKHAPGKLNRSDNGENPPPVSRSKARWDHLRQHVIGAQTRSATPPIASSQSSPAASQHTSSPSRSQTPKPSRLARFGFRHVVDQARELGVDDAHKFAVELRNLCWSIRSAESHRKVDREPTGSSLHLHFMSNTSLSTMGNSSTDSFSHSSNKKFELRRPPSTQSLTHAHYSISSIGPLYQSLLKHATPTVNGAFPAPRLPVEAEVLSTLLAPFTASERGVHVDDEMRLAVEAFGLITRTWPPSNEVSPFAVRDVASLMKHTGRRS